MSYIGGKARGASHILAVLNDPRFDGYDYLEPFVGMGHVLRRVVNKRSYAFIISFMLGVASARACYNSAAGATLRRFAAACLSNDARRREGREGREEREGPIDRRALLDRSLPLSDADSGADTVLAHDEPLHVGVTLPIITILPQSKVQAQPSRANAPSTLSIQDTHVNTQLHVHTMTETNNNSEQQPRQSMVQPDVGDGDEHCRVYAERDAAGELGVQSLNDNERDPPRATTVAMLGDCDVSACACARPLEQVAPVVAVASLAASSAGSSVAGASTPKPSHPAAQAESVVGGEVAGPAATATASNAATRSTWAAPAVASADPAVMIASCTFLEPKPLPPPASISSCNRRPWHPGDLETGGDAAMPGRTSRACRLTLPAVPIDRIQAQQAPAPAHCDALCAETASLIAPSVESASRSSLLLTPTGTTSFRKGVVGLLSDRFSTPFKPSQPTSACRRQWAANQLAPAATAAPTAAAPLSYRSAGADTFRSRRRFFEGSFSERGASTPGLTPVQERPSPRPRSLSPTDTPSRPSGMPSERRSSADLGEPIGFCRGTYRIVSYHLEPTETEMFSC